MNKWSIIFLTLCVFLISQIAYADVYVRGYTRSNGTYVQGHYRSSPNSTVTDNYSYCGNVNPHTGKVGRRHCGTTTIYSYRQARNYKRERVYKKLKPNKECSRRFCPKDQTRKIIRKRGNPTTIITECYENKVLIYTRTCINGRILRKIIRSDKGQVMIIFRYYISGKICGMFTSAWLGFAGPNDKDLAKVEYDWELMISLGKLCTSYFLMDLLK